MAVQAWFARNELLVRPGDMCTLSLSVENLSAQTETFTIIPAGLIAGWTTVTRPSVTLEGGSRETVEVVVRPPVVHTTSAGPTTAAVRVIPAGEPDDAAVAEATLDVQTFDDRRISVLQPMQRARRRATFEFLVENRGNDLASCRLYLVDPTSRLDGSFDPPAVGVAPGSITLVRCYAKASRRQFRRADRQLDFDIEAAQPDHESAIGRAALVQPPTIPGRLISRAAAVAVLAALIAGAWVAVIRPEIRDAAQRAVDDRIAVPAVAGPSNPARPAGDQQQPVITLVLDAPVAPPVVAEGTPFVTRIQVRATIGSTSSENYTVPDGERLELTDVVLQNPNNDLGIVTLLRNDEVLYQWDLAMMSQPNEFQPRLTPIPVNAGDELVMRATCEGSGDSAGTGCDVAVLLGGRVTAS